MRTLSGAFVFETQMGHLTLSRPSQNLFLHIKQANQARDTMGSPGDPEPAQRPTPSGTGFICRLNPEPCNVESDRKSKSSAKGLPWGPAVSSPPSNSGHTGSVPGPGTKTPPAAGRRATNPRAATNTQLSRKQETQSCATRPRQMQTRAGFLGIKAQRGSPEGQGHGQTTCVLSTFSGRKAFNRRVK